MSLVPILNRPFARPGHIADQPWTLVWHPEDDVSAAVAAGARFLVSPGSTTELIDAAIALGVPILPGVATASEAMVARDKMASFASDAPVPVQPGREQVSISVSGTVQMR
jgi:hypothetical protein